VVSYHFSGSKEPFLKAKGNRDRNLNSDCYQRFQRAVSDVEGTDYDRALMQAETKNDKTVPAESSTTWEFLIATRATWRRPERNTPREPVMRDASFIAEI
jgi:hypothetical protein